MPVFDVVVVGSGAAGMLAAVRALDSGLSVAVLEKASFYGGTSATSGGGLWIPNHGLGTHADSRDEALAYLGAVCVGDVRRDRIESFVDHGPLTVRYLEQIGVKFTVFPGCPDYFPEADGAVAGRALFPAELDGERLAASFFKLREAPFAFKFLNRYSLDLAQSFALSARPPGWWWVALKIFANYWSDLGWRRKTRRDRRLTMGNALVGGLRMAFDERGGTLLLETRADRLRTTGNAVTGVEAVRNGKRYQFEARHGVILAAGGFEQDQVMRDKHLPVSTEARWSFTPKGGNVGDAVRLGEAIGAATEFMDCCWWAPSMQLPSLENPNVDTTHQLFFDHRHPHSVCVNRLGKRFVNESCSYDRFGMSMIEDQRRTGANVPCWMIFDASYRNRYTAGGIMPSSVMPDRKIPQAWWDGYLYRADSVAGLAAKIDLDPNTLMGTIEQMNRFAREGVDPEFGRGGNTYDRYFGDNRIKPNPCMAPIETAPFYAVRVDLGDLGSKGGLKADAKARVLDKQGAVIEGLYAVGNSAGSPFGDCYPGSGGTLGPAAVFAFVAANEIVARAAFGTMPGDRLEETEGPQRRQI